ncbi:MAG: class I SAM-dependent methyltransferase [Verrucomicrobia bacterium]|nr:class I SAM-dependent methyltransferase [Verrucomicrobiota bacterium]
MSDSARQARLKARCAVFYALRVYLPLSHLARAVRARSRSLRGKPSRHQQDTQLPDAPWHRLFPSQPAFIVESAKANGNVRVSELAVLAKAATTIAPGREIVEIGTFDGRTTLNLAVNSDPATPVFTLDLPPDAPTKFALDHGERKFVDKPAPGERYRRCGAPWKDSAGKIVQLLGDSGSFDWSAHFGKAGLVFVDGSHAYDYARHDTEMAFKLVSPDGVVIWHDYGVWQGVTRALEELERERHLGLRQVRGTSLVFWRANGQHLAKSQT